ncbi:MAG: Mpo1-like protein [Candidatus Dormibacteria bacterium]
MAGTYTSFDDFYPYYVSQHSKRATRCFHFAGTHLGALTAAAGLARGRPRMLLAFPVISYSLAWFSHFVIEGNNPASFGHPLWSLRGDFKMLSAMWQGRDADLQRIADDELASQQAA